MIKSSAEGKQVGPPVFRPNQTTDLNNANFSMKIGDKLVERISKKCFEVDLQIFIISRWKIDFCFFSDISFSIFEISFVYGIYKGNFENAKGNIRKKSKIDFSSWNNENQQIHFKTFLWKPFNSLVTKFHRQIRNMENNRLVRPYPLKKVGVRPA